MSPIIGNLELSSKLFEDHGCCENGRDSAMFCFIRADDIWAAAEPGYLTSVTTRERLGAQMSLLGRRLLLSIGEWIDCENTKMKIRSK